jgi:hypothetical protein
VKENEEVAYSGVGLDAPGLGCNRPHRQDGFARRRERMERSHANKYISTPKIESTMNEHTS